MEQTCQMRALIKGVLPEGRVRPNTVFWCDVNHAKNYIENNVAELIGPAPVGPTETKPAGPSQTPESSPEKKTPEQNAPANNQNSLPTVPAGPLTGSAALIEPGRVTPSASSAAGKVSRRGKSRTPKPGSTSTDGRSGSSQ